MDQWMIEPLTKDHDRSTFSCGRQPLDDFFRVRVSQYEKRNLGRTFVAVPSGRKSVIGYFTLAASSVSFEHLPSKSSHKLPKHPGPVVLLARLAVDQTWQRKGLGEGLLLDALQRSLAIAVELGIYAVAVDAIDNAASTFYQKYGFIALLDHPLHLYLPVATFEKTLSEKP
jgi:GNAT superfamily N-acetyltransferase